MKIENPKYKNILTATMIVFMLVLFFEIIPGYYNISVNLFSVLIQKISGDNYEQLTEQLIELKGEGKNLKKFFNSELSSDISGYSFSETLEKFNVTVPDFDLIVTSIKPVKKLQKGKLNFQRISIVVQSDYGNIYNYFRWLEMTGPSFNFEEVKISKAKDINYLQTNMLVDVLYGGIE